MKKLLIILFTCFFSVGFTQVETTLVKIGDQVPVFDFEKSAGVSQSISSLKGKVVLITFFATWCGPCKKELPVIQSVIYNKYKDNPDFQMLIIGREHKWDEINKFKADNKFSMPFFPDPERKIYSKFATQFIPRNFLISRDGKIVFSTIGFEEKDFNQLKEVLAAELKKK